MVEKEDEMASILQKIADHELSVDMAMNQLKDPGFVELNYAKVDTDRPHRTGYPEVIYGEGKTASQILGIIQTMVSAEMNVLVTRVSPEKAAAVLAVYPKMIYHDTAQILTWQSIDVPPLPSAIAIVTAGTSDLRVAEEAALTAEAFGNSVSRVYDVGVAGIHRLFARLDVIRQSQVVIVIAGMEGALASVVGGLVDKPVIAVPTSVGYGANFGGMSALLTMLNSCASGITVVNIDNGFGAGYSASQINHLTENTK
ncbi:nickel pincer cofactor biosynthesis protein LarB [uncultured Secundilactobacillus sp.]|uniref:nickel pincer cofactor biosynthesis protein LarB n=1 Tax=uncultured Secundilactobacillus sp. TaxID=2813935 RepID=UPI002583E3B1|nr:nickel pincer cofactor biosynthesis protein LarB [uncultured Secundilactobacillus sp.]